MGFLTPCQENSPSGTRQLSWQIMHALSHLSLTSHRQQGSWPHRHHSGAWLLALPVTNCGMRLDDKAVRVAVSMRLGLSLCIPHECRGGTLVDAHGLHAMVARRHEVNTPGITFLMTSSGVPLVQPASQPSKNRRGYAETMENAQTDLL